MKLEADGGITIRFRHLKEEPPALVEQTLSLLMRELGVVEQRQQTALGRQRV